MLELVAEMEALGWELALWRALGPPLRVWCAEWRQRGRQGYGQAETAPMAVARAALQALEVGHDAG